MTTELQIKIAKSLGVTPRSHGWYAFNEETGGIAYQGDFKSDVENWLDSGFRRRKTYVAKEDLRFPDYFSDPAAALTLVDALKKDGWRPRLEQSIYNEVWYCVLHRGAFEQREGQGTFSEAIVAAYCKVKEIV